MIRHRVLLLSFLLPALFVFNFCKTKKKVQKSKTLETIAQPVPQEDTTLGRCRLDFKSAKTLSKHVKENEFQFDWITAKANVEAVVDSNEQGFDIKVNVKKDSAILVSIQYLLGLQVAKILITKDSVRFVNYIQKTYFSGDFDFINDLLNANLDYEAVQAVLFGSSAEFHDDDTKLKPVTDRKNCHYLLSTVRKRRLKRIQKGKVDLKEDLQILTLNPENYKILRNEFDEPNANRKFIANYSDFSNKDSLYAPRRVDIEISAQKKANVKINYVRIEKNPGLKLTLNIPAKYDAIIFQKK